MGIKYCQLLQSQCWIRGRETERRGRKHTIIENDIPKLCISPQSRRNSCLYPNSANTSSSASSPVDRAPLLAVRSIGAFVGSVITALVAIFAWGSLQYIAFSNLQTLLFSNSRLLNSRYSIPKNQSAQEQKPKVANRPHGGGKAEILIPSSSASKLSPAADSRGSR